MTVSVQQISTPLLALDGVALSYHGGRRWLPSLRKPQPTIIRHLSFKIGRGEVLALLGESGSGKSTVARAVSGLIAPKSGQILFEDAALPGLVHRRSTDMRRRIQYIFQNPDASLNPRMRVGRIIARPLELLGTLDSGAIDRRVLAALDDVRLDGEYVRRFPDQLSGGERQRIAIARALVADPALLLCDEILSALDVSVQANVLELLRRLRAEHQLAMLFISHDLAVVRNLADRVGVLFRGTLMEIGRTDDIFMPPFHP